MNVLSLFDGMSCGRIALGRLNIKVDNYYASEIDKYAMKVSEANYPDIIQVGDVTQLDTSTLPKIDLIMGGSPCQGFSFAGKQLAFDDPRSALFFEFVRCVKELKPKYFLLENVRMKKEYLDIISEQIGVEPIMINSALVSAQNRVRYYWTNIPDIEQPKQRGIVLRDILETNPDNNLDKMTNKQGKSYALTASYNGAVAWNSLQRKQRTMVPVMQKPIKVGNIYPSGGQNGNIFSADGKSPTLSAGQGKTGRGIGSNNSPKIQTYDTPKQVGTAIDINGHLACNNTGEPKVIKGGAMRARSVNKDGKNIVWKETKPKQMLELRKDDKSNAISSVTKDSLVVTFSEDRIKKFKETLKDDPQPSVNGIIQLNNPSHSSGRVYSPEGKSPTLMAGNSGGGKEPVKINDDVCWRKLTPVECERLQTVPDDYTNHVSNTQRYKMLGNGWNIETITHILKKIKEDI